MYSVNVVSLDHIHTAPWPNARYESSDKSSAHAFNEPSRARSVAASKITSMEPSEFAILAPKATGAGARCACTTYGDVTAPPGNVAVTEYSPGTRGINPVRNDASTRSKVTTSSPGKYSMPSGGVTVAVTAVFSATAGSVMTLPRESLASIARPNVAVTSKPPARVMEADELSGRIEETAPSAAPG